MDSTTLAHAFEGYEALVSHAMDEGHEIADALCFLAQAVDDMEHNGRTWSLGGLTLLLRALEKRSRDLGEYLDNESTARSPKPTAEESAMREKQDVASRVWSDGMRVIYEHPNLAGEVADALKTILDKVKTEAPQK